MKLQSGDDPEICSEIRLKLLRKAFNLEKKGLALGTLHVFAVPEILIIRLASQIVTDQDSNSRPLQTVQTHKTKTKDLKRS